MKRKFLSLLIVSSLFLSTTTNVFAASNLSESQINIDAELTQESESFDEDGIILEEYETGDESENDESNIESNIDSDIDSDIDIDITDMIESSEDASSEDSADSELDSIMLIDIEDEASNSGKSSDEASKEFSVDYSRIKFGYRELDHESDIESVLDGAENNPDFDDVIDKALPSKWINPDLPRLRDQGNFGTCWAHQAMAMAEIYMMKKGTYSSADFSELHLSYFTYNNVADPLGGTEGDINRLSSGCADDFLDVGGNTELALSVLSGWTGAADETTAPYSTAYDVRYSGLDSAIAYKDKVHLVNYYIEPISTSNLTPIKNMIYKYGSVGINYNHYDIAYNASKNSYYNPYGYGAGGHAVTIVGWDDNFSKNNFTYTPEGDGAWLIRNSWTTDPDEYSLYGYFWMSYYETTTSDNRGYVYAAEFDKANNYDNSYQYDGGFETYGIYADKFANVFTVKANNGKAETLKAVSFYTPSSNMPYSIKVYNDPTASNPEHGSVIASASGTTSYSGYYTIPLSPVSVASGSKFAVVVDLNGGSNASLGVEHSMEISNWFTTTCSLKSGQSYTNSGSWRDMNDSYYPSSGYGNLRIKAFTSNSSVSTSYKITLNPNGGSVSPEKITIKTTTYSGLPTPKRTGYTFKGWNSKKDGSGTTVKNGSKLIKKANHTLYAKWAVNKYTIAFNSNGGTGSMTKMTAAYGKSYTLTKNAFKKTGYKFNGWNTAKDGSGKKYADAASVKNLSSKSGATITLYAQWKLLSYKVTFNSNGGSAVAAQTVKYDTKKKSYGVAKKPANPTRKGYTFKGWYSDKELKKAYDFATPVKKNITLYAKWAANKYTIKFNANKGTGSMTSLSATYNKSLTLTKNTFKRTGHKFNGWNTAKDGSGTKYADGATVKNLSSKSGGTVTLYAQWKVVTYKVAFESNGGSTVSTQIVSYDAKYDKYGVANKPANPTRKGYTFKGWYSDKELTKAYKFSTLVKKNITLYAKWALNKYTISFNANGGKGTMKALSATYGKNVTLTKCAFTRSGYYFAGWNTKKDGSGTTYKNAQAVKNLSTKNGATVTLYAIWKKNS